MTEVKALFPIGKTQWRKWNNDQRRAFNTLREQGKSHNDAVVEANTAQPTKKSEFLLALEETIEQGLDELVAVISTGKSRTPRKKKA